ncbi:MAG: transketolase [Pseudomonadota bacterium]|nr:transketolase [Pseudomonadota bacterium]
MVVDHNALANAIRALSMDAVQQAKSGHPGMPMGAADMATVLFRDFLKFDPSQPDWPDRDRFVLSAGHGSMLLYSLLHLTGYADITMDEIRNFRQLGSRTAGHPEYGHAAGIETTTGPLGQGIATAVGMALAERMMAARHGDDIVDHHTYVIAGDGDLMEGISHEAISLAGRYKLGKLIVLYDDNEITIDGGTGLSVADDQIARFQACQWDAVRVDGHDADAIQGAIENAGSTSTPSLIACRTTIGYGAPTKAGTSGAHGAPLGDDEIAGAREKLGWDSPPFEVPDNILAAWREIGARGASARAAWDARLAGLNEKARDNFVRGEKGELPDGWRSSITRIKQQFSDDAPKMATRQSSGAVLEALTKAAPEMVGGSADLTGSNNTRPKDFIAIEVAQGNGAIEPAQGDIDVGYAGRYINYGVREHGMAAAMNGMALHGGLIPYAGTFLIFADYLRPALRLSALMGQRVIHVLTHDSIGLGEDGPTHQPVETLASLRAIPNVNVFRPADAVEVAECWELAVGNASGPSVLALTRQGLPTFRTTDSVGNLSARGGYVLSPSDGAAQATLLATGSEVEIAMAAQAQLAGQGVASSVVSMPCWELFNAQTDDYRASVLGENTVRVAVEAAIRMGWDQYIGPDGGFVGMTGFGASAPAGDLYKHFGITADAVTAEVQARLGK